MENLPEEQRRAWLLGQWDIFEGQYFAEFDRNVHVCRPHGIPAHWRRYVTLDYGMGPVSVRALLDTGNHLTEVFSGSPVAVVRREAVESALPSSVLAAARCAHAGETSPDGAAIPQAAAGDSGIRLVPYRSVGGKGLLPAFRPQSASLLSSAGISRDVTGIYTALCSDLGRGGYDALIGSDLAELTGRNASKPSEGQDKRG